MIPLFIGLNALDLVLTGIALSMGGVEVGWYALIGLQTIWQIVLARIGLVALLLWLVHRWKMRRFILYGNIVLIIVCLWNLIAILLMWRYK
jgi:hypothetical protein